MAKKSIGTRQMGVAQLATEACDRGFQEAVGKMVEILLQGWIIAQTPTEQKQAVQRFRNGLGIYKEAYASAQQAIAEVFVSA
jgi:hypothetical protein